MLAIAGFLVISIIELQNSFIVRLCCGLQGRISIAPTALPVPLPFFPPSSQWFAVRPSLSPPPFFPGVKFFLLLTH